jgi:hypothetical protein
MTPDDPTPAPPAPPDKTGAGAPAPTAAMLAALGEIKELVLQYSEAVNARIDGEHQALEQTDQKLADNYRELRAGLDDLAAQLHDFGVRLGLLKPNAPPPKTAEQLAAEKAAADDMVFDGVAWVPRPKPPAGSTS